MPRLSVIIPVFNVEKYLRGCLDSILSQSFDDIEVICVDDGSTDHSFDILKEYALTDKRVHVLKQANGYAGVARNNGLKLATGEYVHFMDADDLLYGPDVYERIFAALKKYDFSNVIRFKAEAFDCATEKKVDDDLYEGHFLKFNKIYDCSDVKVLEYFLLSSSVVPWLGFVRRDFIIQNQLEFNDLYCCNDRSFFVSSVLAAQKVLLVDVLAVKHRVNNRVSLVGRRDLHFDCDLKSLDVVQKFLEKYHFSPEVCRCVYAVEAANPFGFFCKYLNSSPQSYHIYCQMREFVQKLNIRFYRPVMEYLWYWHWVRDIKLSLFFPSKIGYWLIKKNIIHFFQRFLCVERKYCTKTFYCLWLPVFKFKTKDNFQKMYVLGIPVLKLK